MENGSETHQNPPDRSELVKIGIFLESCYISCRSVSGFDFLHLLCCLWVCCCVSETCVCQHVWRMYGGNGVWPEIKNTGRGSQSRKGDPAELRLFRET